MTPLVELQNVEVVVVGSSVSASRMAAVKLFWAKMAIMG